MHRLMTDVKLIMESSAELQLGVNTKKSTTEWLRQWYARLGFAEKVAPSLSLRSSITVTIANEIRFMKNPSIKQQSGF
jgi:hypothetical protein